MPDTYGRGGFTQFLGDLDRRLAPPASTYGLHDEAKLVASRHAMRQTGAVLESRNALSLEPGMPGVGSAGADAD